MQSSKTAFVTSPVFRRHDTGQGHPERPGRLDAVVDAVTRAPWFEAHVQPTEPMAVTRAALERCHGAGYLDTVAREVAAIEPGRVRPLSTGDVMISPGSREAALLAAGGACQAVDRVMSGQAANAFCAVRPPGHHARPSQGMGFCLYNNIAVAARHAQATHKIEKVLIVDWDVHHGNGTQDIFYDDPSVFFFSTHQSPLYPGTGAADETGVGRGKGTTMNCPLPAGSGRAQVVDEAFKGKLLAAADAFKPELVLISAGFDAHADDPLGGFTLQADDFAELTNVMMQVAQAHAGGRLVSCLEGGYHLEALGASARAHVGALCGQV